MSLMLFMIFGINQNVINENYEKFIQKFMKNTLNIVHENGRSIAHTKKHYQILIMIVSCPKLESDDNQILSQFWNISQHLLVDPSSH